MRRALRLALLLTVSVAATTLPAAAITLQDRIAAQRAIEEVYWRHRLWPAENKTPKPSLDALPAAAISARVERYLKESFALETLWHRPITRDQLQAELDRMVRDSRDPKLLGELFDALGRDADLIGETLARQVLAERLIRSWAAGASPEPFDTFWDDRKASLSTEIESVGDGLVLPTSPASACTNDSWSPTRTELPDGRIAPYAVWTGTEMIVWGGQTENEPLNTGARYKPATDSWTAMAIPASMSPGVLLGTAIWTGTEMIVWGGFPTSPAQKQNTGARYNPVTDTWTPTSTGPGVPERRWSHTAVWTGSRMLIWGGFAETPAGSAQGGGYDPVSDTWTPLSVSAGTPSPREGNTAVWTGSEMIVWGGSEIGGSAAPVNTGGRYNPSTDVWTPTFAGGGTPAARTAHTAVWTGSEMIVWGGMSGSGGQLLNSGGRYNPVNDSWTPTSVGANAPMGRRFHSATWTGSAMIVLGGTTSDPNLGAAYAPTSDSWSTLPQPPLTAQSLHAVVWTGSELIVWGGGTFGTRPHHEGARYKPANQSWVPTSLGGVPAEREGHTAVWTGTEMIVWGGRPTNFDSGPMLDSGGRYTPATDSWVPTSRGSGVPSGRQRHVAVWTGREMLVWSGRDSVPLNSGGRYDPVTDSWLPMSTGSGVPTLRSHPHAVWSGTEMIVFGDATITGGRYNPSSNTWAPTAVGPTYAGDGQTAVWTGIEMLIYQGGFGAAGRYNPATNSWGAMAPAPLSNRLDSSSVWTGSEMIVWGGDSPTTNAGARYNPATNVWTPTSTGANVATPRGAHTAVWTGNEMLIWGGTDASSPSDPTRGSRYEPMSDTWQSMSIGPNQPAQRVFHSAIWTGRQLIVWGGSTTTATGGVYCACPDGRIVYRDADGDGFGDTAVTAPSCGGAVPAGYSATPGDCNDASAVIHPGAIEACNAIDDDCDGLIDDSASGADTDGDTIHDACDNCPDAYNRAQTDQNNDGEGDACDANDGEIFVFGPSSAQRVEWQSEFGETSWNVYFGDLAVLRSYYYYTQAPGSNPLAARYCGLTQPWLDDPGVVPAGKTRFTLVTGVTAGVEGSLGYDCQGNLRLNLNPCP